MVSLRYALNIKGLAFKTEWIEYPDIQAFYKQHNIPHVDTKPDGSPHYTLPLIHDASTGKFIADSFGITAYLDEQYPHAPTLLPKGTHALQSAFQFAVGSVLATLGRIIMPATHTILNEASQGYFHRTKGIDKLRIPEDKLDEHWKKFEAEMGIIDDWLKRNGEGQKFITGDSITYADIHLTARLLWIKKVLEGQKEQGDEIGNGWDLIKEWHGGRWAGIVAEFEQYE
jgi:glutathione S-transferase